MLQNLSAIYALKESEMVKNVNFKARISFCKKKKKKKVCTKSVLLFLFSKGMW